ncbi:MAG: MarR family transcriptional regulator [Rhodospirillales bacterium]|nr:MarR family transcriptional regulator [Rhodospirillales bacterium]
MVDPDSSIGFLVGDVARLLRRNFNQRAQALGLSQAQWRALAYLARQQGVSQASLADRLEIQPITLVRLLDRLQAAGLVTRRPDPHDRRAFRLYLTDRAQPLLARMWSIAARTREQALAGMPIQRQRMLIKSLQHLRQNLLQAEDSATANGQKDKRIRNAANA